MLRWPLLPEKGGDRIRPRTIVGATAVRAVANILTSPVDHLHIVTRNPVVDRTTILTIIIRVADIQRKAGTNIKSHGRDQGPDPSHLILRHRLKDVVKTALVG